MSRVGSEVYELDDDEFEVLETEEQGPITSEEVKRKLNNPADPVLGPIEQNDFDKKGYTLSDYFLQDEDAYPKNITDRENLESAAAIAVTVGVLNLGIQIVTGESMATSYIGGTAIGTAYAGYRNQEMDLDEAFENSREYWSEKIG